MLDQRLAARDGVGIAVDAEDAAIGGLEDGAGISAAAEGAIDVVLAVLRREQLQHVGEHDGNVAAHPPPSFAASKRAFMRATLSASTAA